MTAIARLVFDNKIPVLLGDILLSSNSGLEKNTHIPTVENLEDVFPPNSKFKPCGLTQKIAIIDENLAIGWAGNYLNSKEIIRDIHAENNTTPFNKDSLDNFFKTIPENIWEDGTGFIGFIKDEKGITSFGYHYYSLRSEKFGEVGFLGTGKNDLETLLREIEANIPNIISGQPNPLEQAATYALILSGVLLNNELLNYASLKNFYGGGYEIASLVNGKFKKIDDIVYVFWEAMANNNSVRISQVPHHAFSVSYQKDVLTIQSASFDELEGNLSMRNSGYAISPMYRTISKQEIKALKLPSLNKRWLCNYFLVTNKFGSHNIYCQVDYRSDNDTCVKFIENKNKIIVAIEDNFLQKVGEIIYQKSKS